MENRTRELKCQNETLNTKRKRGRPATGDLAQRMAKQYGVSRSTVIRAGKYAEAVDKLPEEERRKIMQVKSTLTRAEVMRWNTESTS